MQFFSQLFWGYHVLFFITIVGVRLSFSSSFFQIRHFFKWLRYSFSSDKKDEEKSSIGAFSALSTALAGSIGTGNIVGVSAAISIGGAGAVFWMFFAAFFGMMTVFAECFLAVYFDDGKSKGAFSYIKRLKKGKILPMVYGVGCVLSALFMGNMAQSNAVSEGMSQLGVSKYITAVLLFIIAFVSAGKGIKFVSKLTEKLVPFMTVLFFALSVLLLYKFRFNIPIALKEIMEGAFSKEAIMGGGAYIAIKTGISRSIFSNEAGLGSSSAAFCEVKSSSPMKMGYLGIFQVFIDTIVMCTLTAFSILCGTNSRIGMNLTSKAFENAFGKTGLVLISICMVLFAFATVLASTYYGKVGLDYVGKGKLEFLFPFLSSLCALVGALWNTEKILCLSDIFNGFMAIPNVLALSYFTPLLIDLIKKEKKLQKDMKNRKKR